MKRRTPRKRRAVEGPKLTIGDVLDSLTAKKNPRPVASALARLLVPLDWQKWRSIAVEWTDVVCEDRLAGVVPATGIYPKAQLVPETIEGFLLASKADGAIVRSKITEDTNTKRCTHCRRHGAKPMVTRDAMDARRAVSRAGLDDAIAFAFAKSSVLVTQNNLMRICRCDLRAWRLALDEYKRDPRAAWASFRIEFGHGPTGQIATST